MIHDTQIKEWFEQHGSPNRLVTKILGVEYIHVRFENDDDMYFTKYGLPHIDHLHPDNFLTDKEWFRNNAVKLPGTSNPYRVRTKTVLGHSRDILLKWNRMGQDIPDSHRSDDLMFASFNSPFEEFSLVMELTRSLEHGSSRFLVQRPLAIFVPAETVEKWKTGRKQHKMQAKIRSRTEIELDMHRSYCVIYEWINGIDAACAFTDGLIDEKSMRSLTLGAAYMLGQKGFIVQDNKPQHIILRYDDVVTPSVREHGDADYGLVDFELLTRTPEGEDIFKKDKRREYLQRQRDRFLVDFDKTFHPHLHHMNILGVDYIYGHVESTRGELWVVGKDPFLFDYFLPERWEGCPRTRISVLRQIYHTVTKDNINLVWKASRVGLRPDMDPFKEEENRILQYGYNSPFEEISLAIELSRKGIPTIYPRAVYMTGNQTDIPDSLSDGSRCRRYKTIRSPDGKPILQKGRDYITIWGFWNGPDEKLAEEDGDFYESIDTLHAYRDGHISKEIYIRLLEHARDRMAAVGIEDLNLRGTHILISIDSNNEIIRDDTGLPEIRICNFEFLRKIIPEASPTTQKSTP